MNRITRTFLNRCFKAGYTQVGINVKRVDDTYPFEGDRNVFGYFPGFPEAEGPRIKGGFPEPAIWGILERMGKACGCGRGHQHNHNSSDLETGFYSTQDGKTVRTKE